MKRLYESFGNRGDAICILTVIACFALIPLTTLFI